MGFSLPKAKEDGKTVEENQVVGKRKTYNQRPFTFQRREKESHGSKAGAHYFLGSRTTFMAWVRNNWAFLNFLFAYVALEGDHCSAAEAGRA